MEEVYLNVMTVDGWWLSVQASTNDERPTTVLNPTCLRSSVIYLSLPFHPPKEATVRLGHKRLITLMKSSNILYLPSGSYFMIINR